MSDRHPSMSRGAMEFVPLEIFGKEIIDQGGPIRRSVAELCGPVHGLYVPLVLLGLRTVRDLRGQGQPDAAAMASTEAIVDHRADLYASLRP